MKSSCCKAKMDVAGHTTKYYTCMKCSQPCDPWQCIRCNKLLDGDFHTCTPSKQYRAGIVEGLKLASSVFPEEIDYYEEYSIVGYMNEIDKLIKQYSGDE